MKRIFRVTLLLGIFLLIMTMSAVAFAAPAQQTPALPILVVNTRALNVRSGPGPQYTVITSVVGGTELPVLGTNPSGTWDLVSTAVGNGWVDIAFTLPRGDFRFVPVVNVLAPAAPVVQQPATVSLPSSNSVPVPVLEPPQIVVNTGRLNVRTGPGPQFTTLGSVPGGTVLDGLATTPDGLWYYVESPLGRGWVYAEFTLLRGFFDNFAVIGY